MENKYQEALDEIKKEHIFIEDYLKKEIDLIQELVDKETSMEVTDVHVDEWYCPNCYQEIGTDSHYKRCPECGQKLDWSDNNETY